MGFYNKPEPDIVFHVHNKFDTVEIRGSSVNIDDCGNLSMNINANIFFIQPIANLSGKRTTSLPIVY